MNCRVLSSALAGIALAVASFSNGAAEARDLRLGLITPPSHVVTLAANRFAEKIAEETGGQLTVSVFPSGQLGSEADMLQQMQSGLLDMTWPSVAAVTARQPTFNAWFTPFLIDNVEMAVQAADTEAAKEMLESLGELGILGKGYVFAGQRHILMRSQPITAVADLRNQKIRITPFRATQIWYQALGAIPTPVSLTDVYQSLQSGLLDGVDIDLDALTGFSLQDVGKQLTLTNHMAWPLAVLMGQEAWEDLSAEHQAAFSRVLDEVLEWAKQEQVAREVQNRERLLAAIDVSEPVGLEDTFSEANAAFQKEFGDIDVVKRFQEQVRGLRAQ